MQVVINKQPFEAAEEPKDYWKWVANGNYDHEWTIYDQYLKPEHTFVDVGAWIGSHSMYAAKRAKSIVSVEPDPVAYEILVENLGSDNHAIRKAIGREGTVRLGSGFLGASTTRTNPNAGGGIGAWVDGHDFEIESITLRQLCADLHDPLFIKIDVEGSEEDIFKDAQFFAERKPTVLVELHPFWWRDESETRKDFEAINQLYSSPIRIKPDICGPFLLTNA